MCLRVLLRLSGGSLLAVDGPLNQIKEKKVRRHSRIRMASGKVLLHLLRVEAIPSPLMWIRLQHVLRLRPDQASLDDIQGRGHCPGCQPDQKTLR